MLRRFVFVGLSLMVLFNILLHALAGLELSIPKTSLSIFSELEVLPFQVIVGARYDF